ncbi:hypothetical protein GIY23_03420 [Allosaccharopolyspora coralli]|uniref:AsnC family protein n=1 Tax=Allosaccharopolyspora coralli TaxID=2665642 RepID=A0A5Q3Q5F9_9PSEU|nr:hypothetical protein [Allosaccharopolyspora coralli]QGK68726.1 hypothetical protein GIY23_03420 [Allosaccharopolyspora coralli]
MGEVEGAAPEQGVAAERLAVVRQVREGLDLFEADALVAARQAGLDWAEIGAALGMSGQAAGKRARQRYQLTDPRTDRDTGRPRTRGTYRPRTPRNADGDITANRLTLPIRPIQGSELR